MCHGQDDESSRIGGLAEGDRTCPRGEDQLCRSARSIPANIAEGFGRFTRPEFRKYLGYALGEAAEVDTHLEIGIRSGFCTEDEARLLQQAYSELGWMIRRLKSSLAGRG